MQLRSFGKYALAALFLIAGINHFLTPDFYVAIIPHYFPYPEFLNYFSGFLEIVFGIGLLIKKTQNLAAWGIIALLILFIPVHIYVIEIAECEEIGLCWISALAWIRLLLIQPLLVFWAWLYTNEKNNGK
jgi:uncharacterized membrane protein